jgi:small Trp-rich protein
MAADAAKAANKAIFFMVSFLDGCFVGAGLDYSLLNEFYPAVVDTSLLSRRAGREGQAQMWLVVVGVLAVVLKLAGIGFVAGLSWWWVLAPFALAAAWWQIADATGITQRAAMRRADDLAATRREAQFEALGLRAPKPGAPPPRQTPTEKARRDL